MDFNHEETSTARMFHEDVSKLKTSSPLPVIIQELNMKLSHRIFLYFGSFTLIIIILFVTVNFFLIQQSLHLQGRRDLLQLVESTDLAVENMLDMAIRNYLRSLVDQNMIVLEVLHEKVQKGILNEAQAKESFQEHVLAQKIGKSGYIVALRPKDQKIIIDIHPFARGTDCAFNQGCRDWVAQKNGYNEYEWKNPADEQVRKKTGYFRYFEPWNWVMGATSYRDEFTQLVKIEDLKHLLGSFSILENGYFVVLDENLNFLVHPELEGTPGQDLKNSDGKFVLRELTNQLDSFYYYRWKNPSQANIKEKFAYTTKLEDFNWYLVATGYMEDVTRPVDKLTYAGYVLIAVVTVLLILLTFLFTRGLSRPLKELITGLQAFYKERTVFKMKNRSVAEVDAVGHAIENMTKALVNSEKENKKMHEILLQGRKMEAIGTLAGGIAHDFNNILSGILGYCELARNNLSVQEKAGRHMDNAMKGIHKASDLVQQILTFSRQSQKKEKLFLKLSETIDDNLILIRASIPSTIEIRKDFRSDKTILADPSQINQIVMNLCTNAYHAMLENGGSISITTTDIKIKDPENISGMLIPPGEYIRVGVKDTGHGMARNTMDKIFDPYFTTKSVGKGTGLGLSLVSGIVQEHNGFIKVLSEQGMGSTFHVFFPVTKDKQALFPRLEDENEAITGGTEQIAVVDDEEDILGSMKTFLKEYGYRVTTFKDGACAYEAYLKNPDRFDLIITDMTMPRMTGQELAKNIFKLKPDQKIIMCTGYSELINEEQAFSMGISGYFEKPVSINELAKTMRQILDRFD